MSVALLSSTWTPTLPPSQTSTWLAPLLMGLITLTGYACGRLKLRGHLPTSDTRKLFHFVIFSTAAVLSLTLGLPAVNLLGGLMALYILTVVRIGEGNVLYEGIARESDGPGRSLQVLVPFAATAAGGILSSLVFGPWATVGYVASGWGDAAGEPVGTRLGRHPYRVPALGGALGRRSVEGSAAVFVAAFGGILVVLLLLARGDAEAARSLASLAGPAALIALATTAVEAVTPRGLDNLTVQLAAAASASALL